MTRQLPWSSWTPRASMDAMSLPAPGSVMSMLPQASPSMISSMAFWKRVLLISNVLSSTSVDPSQIDISSMAMAMPPWKP